MKSKALAVFVSMLLCVGCAVSPKQSEQRSLSDVVDALQFAVDDIAAKKDLWKGSEQEFSHWAGACKAARQQASQACTAMLSQADVVCRAACSSGSCGAAHQEICRKLSVGEDRGGLCTGAFKGSAWCPLADACASAADDRDRLCGSAKSTAVPKLKQATVSLATEEANESSGTVKLLVVAFGGGAGRTATNAITLTLLPRVREADYGSVPLPGLDRPEAKVLSPAAAALAQDIRALLLSAIQSVATDYDQTGGKAVRPPMATAGIDIELALTLTSKGTIGIEKAWTLPAGIELSNTASSKSANTLKLSFARE